MDVGYFFDRFKFNNETIFNEEIDSAFTDQPTFIRKLDRSFLLKLNSSPRQFDR